ncbi:MAG: hypothetical protein AAFV93_03370 [Chloroflexota bacterium]
MSRLNPIRVLLLNLEEKFKGDESKRKLYVPKEEALSHLKQMTGQDFGYDIKAWRKYLHENKFYP